MGRTIGRQLFVPVRNSVCVAGVAGIPAGLDRILDQRLGHRKVGAGRVPASDDHPVDPQEQAKNPGTRNGTACFVAEEKTLRYFTKRIPVFSIVIRPFFQSAPTACLNVRLLTPSSSLISSALL